MNITVFGAGYVGLVTGACFADMGNHVVGVDVDAKRVDLLNSGRLPIHEPGLEAMIASNRAAGRLSFTTDALRGVAHGDVIFIAVGTPPLEDGGADLSHVLTVARTIGQHCQGFKVIVSKSTVPVGTADLISSTIAEEIARRAGDSGSGPGQPTFTVLSNPEFLKEGAAVADFTRPDRVVLGADQTPEGQRGVNVLRQLYAPLTQNHERTVQMDLRSAELTKYAANAMLATRISFMNELANLAEEVGADIEAIRRGIGSDPRIGYSFLYAGVGYGGSCFPKDLSALQKTAREHGRSLLVLEAVTQANAHQRHVIIDKVRRRFGSDLSGMTFAMWGLAFKPNTDDMRDSPSRTVIRDLVEAGAQVQAFDPVAMSEAERVLSIDLGARMSQVSFFRDSSSVLEGADALVVATEWKQFRSPDFSEMRRRLRRKAIFDGRNIYDHRTVEDAGLEYFPIGRRQSLAEE